MLVVLIVLITFVEREEKNKSCENLQSVKSFLSFYHIFFHRPWKTEFSYQLQSVESGLKMREEKEKEKKGHPDFYEC
jgi:hypothetical protein